jgi:hypothetical protein
MDVDAVLDWLLLLCANSSELFGRKTMLDGKTLNEEM